jgi:quercetin dioxygenase-like cupin family protein
MVGQRDGSRAAWMVTALLLFPLAAWHASGQTPAAAPQAPGATPNFTGGVKSVDASDVRGVRFTYEPGARSFWHAHDGPLVLLIEKGRGRMQLQGEKIRDILPGLPVVLPAGVAHWHGAAPDQGLTWVALSVGRNVKWMGPVSEDEYLGRK